LRLGSALSNSGFRDKGGFNPGWRSTKSNFAEGSMMITSEAGPDHLIFMKRSPNNGGVTGPIKMSPQTTQSPGFFWVEIPPARRGRIFSQQFHDGEMIHLCTNPHCGHDQQGGLCSVYGPTTLRHEGPEKTTREGVNGSQSKFL
jgi:hypothetical protein